MLVTFTLLTCEPGTCERTAGRGCEWSALAKIGHAPQVRHPRHSNLARARCYTDRSACPHADGSASARPYRRADRHADRHADCDTDSHADGHADRNADGGTGTTSIGVRS